MRLEKLNEQLQQRLAAAEAGLPPYPEVIDISDDDGNNDDAEMQVVNKHDYDALRAYVIAMVAAGEAGLPPYPNLPVLKVISVHDYDVLRAHAIALGARVAEVLQRRCTNPRTIGDSACDCCQHHWYALNPPPRSGE